MTSVEVVVLICVLAHVAALYILAGERELVLGQAHGAEVSDRILPLDLLTLVVPL